MLIAVWFDAIESLKYDGCQVYLNIYIYIYIYCLFNYYYRQRSVWST